MTASVLASKSLRRSSSLPAIICVGSSGSAIHASASAGMPGPGVAEGVTDGPGVGVPASGAGVPAPGVGVPASGVGVPAPGVGVPASGAGVPAPGVGVPAAGCRRTCAGCRRTCVRPSACPQSGVGVASAGVGVAGAGVGVAGAGVGVAGAGVGVAGAGVGVEASWRGASLTGWVFPAGVPASAAPAFLLLHLQTAAPPLPQQLRKPASRQAARSAASKRFMSQLPLCVCSASSGACFAPGCQFLHILDGRGAVLVAFPGKFLHLPCENCPQAAQASSCGRNAQGHPPPFPVLPPQAGAFAHPHGFFATYSLSLYHIIFFRKMNIENR